jgi:hypothetical protein
VAHDALVNAVERLDPATKRNDRLMEWEVRADSELRLVASSSVVAARVRLVLPRPPTPALVPVLDPPTTACPEPRPWYLNRPLRLSSRYLLEALATAGGHWVLRWSTEDAPMLWGPYGADPEYAAMWVVMPVSQHAPRSAWAAVVAGTDERSVPVVAPAAEPASAQP